MANEFSAARFVVDRAIKELEALGALRDALRVAETAQANTQKALKAQKEAEAAATAAQAEVAAAQRMLQSVQAGVLKAETEAARLTRAAEDAARTLSDRNLRLVQQTAELDAGAKALAAQDAERAKVASEVSALVAKRNQVSQEHMAEMTTMRYERDAMAKELDGLRARFVR